MIEGRHGVLSPPTVTEPEVDHWHSESLTQRRQGCNFNFKFRVKDFTVTPVPVPVCTPVNFKLKIH